MADDVPSADELVRRAQAGDQDALGQLVGMHRNYLWLLGNLHLDGQLQAKVDASDLVQDACLQVHRDFAGFQGTSHGEFLGEDAVRRERAVLLADALANLPADDREVIMLHHFQGLSMPQIAEHVARSVPSVQKVWSRALVRLRRELKGTL